MNFFIYHNFTYIFPFIYQKSISQKRVPCEMQRNYLLNNKRKGCWIRRHIVLFSIPFSIKFNFKLQVNLPKRITFPFVLQASHEEVAVAYRNYIPICFATSSAKFSSFFSSPSPVSKRTNDLSSNLIPSALATSAT